jgi:hypothetical protein
VCSSCSISGTRRVNLVANPVISHECGNDREVLTTSGIYPWSFVSTESERSFSLCYGYRFCDFTIAFRTVPIVWYFLFIGLS